MRSRQSGITLIGFVFILMIAGFFALMAFKLVPPYMEFFGVRKAMNQVATEGVDGRTPNAVRRDFMFKLNFQYADQVIHPEDIHFVHGNGGTDLEVNYDQRVHFVYNIDFLLHFQNTVRLNGSLTD